MRHSLFISAILIGFRIFVLCAPPMNKLTDIFPAMKGNVLYIYLFVLCSMLRSLSAQFVKAKQMVKLYALSGVLGTATTLLFDILFLVVFTGVLNIFYGTGDPLWQWGFLKITRNGILNCVFISVRILSLIHI